MERERLKVMKIERESVKVMEKVRVMERERVMERVKVMVSLHQDSFH